MNSCILVFGMPRSGTTWIGKLFDSHPGTLYRHEPDSFRPLSLPLFPEKESASHYRDELDRFVASLPRMRSPEVVGKQPLFPKSYQSAAALAFYRISVLAAKAASRVRRHSPCVYRPTGEGSPQARLVWKSIESSGRLGVCIEALPETRAIHLLRHPCGYVASLLRGVAAHRFADGASSTDNTWLLERLLATSTGRTHGLNVDDLKRLSLEERLAWCWVLTNQKILADVTDSARVLTVRYEDVCAEPLAMTRRMFDFAGLDWSAQTASFIDASTAAADAGYYSVFKRPQAAAQRWRSELAPPVIDRILRILRGTSLSRYYDEGVPSSQSCAQAAT